jgi:threonylcarbamoyladenosine tRNA methylthiotransferase MtaB
MKYFAVFTLGCRVNSAESNLFAQKLLDKGFQKNDLHPDLIFVNTCSVTAKANVESLGLIRQLKKIFPKAKIIVSGCADTKNISNLPNLKILSNFNKEKKLNILKSLYNPKVGDKFSHTHRYLLKIQSGCSANCSYCTVPLRRPYLWSLPINDAIDTVNSALRNGYREVIITGVNLNQYTPGFSNLLEALLTQTKIPLISFGSIPLLCIDNKFINLIKNHKIKIKNYFHIPLQSGSDKILKLMHRPYTKEKILNTFNQLKKIKNITFGTDIIVGFPGETDADFQETLDLCRSIGFSKIHVFRFSPRPRTPGLDLFSQSHKIPQTVIKERSQKIRLLQTNH